MKNSILVKILIFIVNLSFAQSDTLQDSSYQIFENIVAEYMEGYDFKINSETALMKYKTGDNDSNLKGVLKDIFTDSNAVYKYLQNPRIYDLEISNNTFDTSVFVMDWVKTIDTDKYDSEDHTIKYNDIETSEMISVHNKQGETVRFISITWDTTYDGVNYSNIRSIFDSFYDH